MAMEKYNKTCFALTNKSYEKSGASYPICTFYFSYIVNSMFHFIKAKREKYTREKRETSLYKQAHTAFHVHKFTEGA